MMIPSIVLGVCFLLAVLLGLLFVLSPFSKDLAAFRTEVRLLAERSGAVSTEANRLASAINGQSRVTGAWTEVGLKRVLELAGLTENTDFTMDDNGVKVKMPSERSIVINSKNSIKSFTRYIGSEGAEKEALRKEIVLSVKEHIDELAAAKVDPEIRRAFDYTLMYIPFEEVYLIAMKAELLFGESKKLLRDYAHEHKILFVNSMSLISVLKAVELSWQQQDADEKAKKIISECGDLSEKITGFAKSYQEVGKTLAASVTAYNTGLSLLSVGPGNALKKVQELAAYGVPEAKEVPNPETLQETADTIPEVHG